MHVCEICLFLLCEYWDMSLFVCESRVTLCGLCCEFLCVHVWMGPRVVLSASILSTP